MDRIKERQKLSWQGMFYSIQRIDLLIISISGAGIYICLETLKYMFENNLNCDLIIKFSGLAFLVCIGVNFISQIYGSKTNHYDYLWCEEKLDCEDQPPNDEQQTRIEYYDLKSEHYSKLTRRLTNWSIILMMSGLCLLLVYFFFIF